MSLDKITADQVNRLGKNGCYLECQDNGFGGVSWKFTHLNLLERILRWLGCFYESTTLSSIAGKVSSAPALPELLNAKMFAIFNRSYPFRENPFRPKLAPQTSLEKPVKTILGKSPVELLEVAPSEVTQVPADKPAEKPVIVAPKVVFKQVDLPPEKIIVGASSISYEVVHGVLQAGLLFVPGHGNPADHNVLYCTGQDYKLGRFELADGYRTLVRFVEADPECPHQAELTLERRIRVGLSNKLKDIQSVAIPLSSLIHFMFPADRAIRVALEACRNHLLSEKRSYDVRFVFPVECKGIREEFVKFAAELKAKGQ